MADSFTLFCLVEGEKSSFPVDIKPVKTVDRLKKAIKKAIKEQKSNDLGDVDADKLTLWRVEIPDEDKVLTKDKARPEEKGVLTKDKVVLTEGMDI
ncbi:hypothetical protein BGZ65_000526, partial [Modicella reniformis]